MIIFMEYAFTLPVMSNFVTIMRKTMYALVFCPFYGPLCDIILFFFFVFFRYIWSTLYSYFIETAQMFLWKQTGMHLFSSLCPVLCFALWFREGNIHTYSNELHQQSNCQTKHAILALKTAF